MIFKTSLKYGLLLGVVVSLATQMLTWFGLGLTNWFILVSIILTILFVARTSNKIQFALQRKLTFQNALSIVVLMVLAARFVFQCYMFVYTRYIDPSWVDTVAQSWTETLQASEASAEQINAQIQSFRNSYEAIPMFTSSLVLFGIPQLVAGLVVSLGFVLKHKFKK